jgi:RNA polymerase sigma-70 factor (ECF subfamily)
MESSIVSRLVHEVRSKTGRVELTETRSRLLALRASLPPEDQELLMLRLDRRLRWEELAQVLHAEDEVPLAPEKLKKETVRLRKRFQLIKDRLREMARRDGLLGDDD